MMEECMRCHKEYEFINNNSELHVFDGGYLLCDKCCIGVLLDISEVVDIGQYLEEVKV